MSDELANLVLDELRGERVRKMFGGWGIYRSGEMVAIVYDGRVYLKAVTGEAQARFIAAGMEPFRPRPGQTFKSFWELPPDALDGEAALSTWLESSA